MLLWRIVILLPAWVLSMLPQKGFQFFRVHLERPLPQARPLRVREALEGEHLTGELGARIRLFHLNADGTGKGGLVRRKGGEARMRPSGIELDKNLRSVLQPGQFHCFSLRMMSLRSSIFPKMSPLSALRSCSSSAWCIWLLSTF